MKKITLVIAMFTMAMAASAQNAGQKFFDNWSIGVDGGINTNLHNWDNGGGVLGLQLTKGITPVVSFEFASQIGLNDIAWDGDGVSWNVLGDKKHISTISAIASTKINLMNWFGGYLGHPRVFEIQARGGIGYLREVEREVNSAVGKVGLDFDFNLGKERAWVLSLRPAVVWNACEYATFEKGQFATAQLTAGVTYRFKTSNGTHNFVNVEPKVVTKIVEKIVEKPFETVRVVEKEVHDTVFVKVENEVVCVEFKNNSAALSDDAIAALDKIEGKKVEIEGFASPVGTKEYNLKLSQQRADNVAAFLKEKGNEIISSVGKGVVGNSKRIVNIKLD